MAPTGLPLPLTVETTDGPLVFLPHSNTPATPDAKVEALKRLQYEIAKAHNHVQLAQRIAYGTLRHERIGGLRRALNRTQNTLIKLLVHKVWP